MHTTSWWNEGGESRDGWTPDGAGSASIRIDVYELRSPRGVGDGQEGPGAFMGHWTSTGTDTPTPFFNDTAFLFVRFKTYHNTQCQFCLNNHTYF